LRLLHDFKAARQRRDEALFGSRDWRAADEEIQDLQHEIFDRSFDDTSGIGGRGIGGIGRTPPGPDDELGQPEDPSAI
jgi:hypothetical protein